MKVIQGKYKSETLGMVEAIWVDIGIGIANFNGTHYTFYSKNDFHPEEEKSTVFPKVTDFFNQPIKEMTITFKD